MKTKILAASAAIAVSSAFGFMTWTGGDGTYQVNTGLGNETKTNGYWFDYGDSDDGGASSVTWPTKKGNEYSADAMDPIIDACSGVCGTAVLSKGSLTYDPFVGIGFNVVGEASATDKTPVAGDASEWGGVCIAYSSEIAASLELGLGGYDKDLAYDNPFVTLPKGDNKVMDLAWADFAQNGWGVDKGGKTISGPDAAKQLVALKFKMQGTDGSYKFNIMSIGAKGGGCAASGGSLPSGDSGTTPGGTTPGGETTPGGTTPGGTTPPAAIGDITVSSAKAILSGRTLSFSGISNAKVEILNLQGQIVMKGSAASSMNLMGLDAGVYMVRIAGKAVNMSQKILVK